MFVLFLISFLLVFISSYFITSIFTPREGKCRNVAFLIQLGTMFAQTVLTFEILSLFKAINTQNVLIANFIFFFAILFYWIKQGKPIYRPDFRSAVKRIWNALKRDKIMMIMFFGMLFFIAVAIVLCILTPVTSFDALTYHLNRSAFWMSQGSLDHFITTDNRNLVMPINSEILYLWVLVFLKNDIGLGFVSLLGYFACVYSVYNILGYFNFSERRKLWSVLILSSFASVIVETSSIETDVLIAGLILSSIYLFLVSLKEKKISLIFFSSLLYALAAGTKSPAIIAFPGVFLLISYIAFKQYNKESIKPIMAFFGLLFINFMIFSSYNYILNFIDYGDFLGSESAKALHEFWGGKKAVLANYIRYIFMLFDFSGFRYSDYVGEHITNFKLLIFSLLHIPENLGVAMPDNNRINNLLLEVKMGTGLFGFLLFLPAVIASIIICIYKKIIKRYSTKIAVLCAFGMMFFINLFCLSFSIAYMVFSVRFVTTMVIISSPVLAISYIKKNNLIKLLILFFAMSYFMVMSTHILKRPLMNVLKVYNRTTTVTEARERIRCSLYKGFSGRNPFCYMRDMIKDTPKGSRFGIIPNYNARLYILKMLENDGYKIDVILPETMNSADLDKYDYIIKTNEFIQSDVIIKKTKDIEPAKSLKNKETVYIPFENKHDLNCFYIAHNTLEPVQKSISNQKTVFSICHIPPAYMEKRGFEYITSLNFKAYDKEDSNFVTIYKHK